MNLYEREGEGVAGREREREGKWGNYVRGECEWEENVNGLKERIVWGGEEKGLVERRKCVVWVGEGDGCNWGQRK